jgi:hypothetical protein
MRNMLLTERLSYTIESAIDLAVWFALVRLFDRVVEGSL